MAEEWKTIRVPKDVYGDAKERKESHGVTWGEYVNPHAWHSVFEEPKTVGDAVVVDTNIQEQLDEIQRTVEQNNGALGDTVEQALEIGEHGFTDIAEQLDTIERAAKAAEERAGSVERQLEEMSR